MKHIIAFVLAISLFACKPKPAKQVVNPAPYSLRGGNKIVFLGDYYTHYLNDLKAGIKNKDSLYRSDIQYPIMHNYFSSCEYADLVGYSFYMPMLDTTGLAGRIVAISSNMDKIEEIISATLADCNKYLKNDSITIYIQPFEGGPMETIMKKMRGIMAVTAGSKQIMITIDPNITVWSDELAFTIAHEFHHTYWTKMNFSKKATWTILNYLVFEGRADSYAHFLYPTRVAPWDTALSEQQKADLWDKIKNHLDTNNTAFQRQVMFGSMDGSHKYPIWGGYCLGYTIVQSALEKNPTLTPEQWTNMDPEKILEMSAYKLSKE